MKKLSYFLLIFILMLTGCPDPYSEPEPVPEPQVWTKHTGNPVMLPGSATDWDKEFVGIGSVIYHNNKYHMWYTGGSFSDTLFRSRIGYATSPDGFTWTKNINNPVLDRGPKGSWDEHVVHAPCVMVINNTFHMWYTGHRGNNGSFDFQIGHATSPDGITWTKDPKNPVLHMGQNGDWDYAWVTVGSVLFDGTKYHMWYTGFSGTSYIISIGHATSSDGVTWIKDPTNPVLIRGNNISWDYPRVDFPSVLFDGATYHMWYSSGYLFQMKIGYATSVDGSNWTKYSLNPVLIPGESGTWDSRSVVTMSVIDSSGIKYKMWYWGSETENFGSIGYAEKLND